MSYSRTAQTLAWNGAIDAGRPSSKCLDFSMASFGGRIEWSDCASLTPAEWSYDDLEIFYTSGQCHHLAIALHRRLGHQICVLFENDPDELEEVGLPIPHHVFALNRKDNGLDIRGLRSKAAILNDFAGTVGLMQPSFVVFDEASFRSQVMERSDAPLCPATEDDIARASTLIQTRMATFAQDHRQALTAWRERIDSYELAASPV